MSLVLLCAYVLMLINLMARLMNPNRCFISLFVGCFIVNDSLVATFDESPHGMNSSRNAISYASIIIMGTDVMWL